MLKVIQLIISEAGIWTKATGFGVCGLNQYGLQYVLQFYGYMQRVGIRENWETTRRKFERIFFICWNRAGFPKHGPNPKAMKENTDIYGYMTDKNLCVFKEAIYKLNV